MVPRLCSMSSTAGTCFKLCSQRQLQADSTRIFRYQYELEEGESVSAAEFIEDVNKDTTVIIDGLTKVCIGLPMRIGC